VTERFLVDLFMREIQCASKMWLFTLLHLNWQGFYFSRKETSNDSRVAHHAYVLRSHVEVYLLCA